jgi:L-seryl-tRNA(Ser) seleniumtransferase
MSAKNTLNIPAVEKVLQALDSATDLPRPLVTAIVREELEKLRASGEAAGAFDAVAAYNRNRLASLAPKRLRGLINGTGVLIHTNLGRSPLSESAATRVAEIARDYCNLEFNLDTGERGKRGGFVERCLALASQAEAATVVNNCASALVLILRFFVREGRREVIISRSQLVEIGGGFRIPDILLASGAVLREIGTTNKTSLADYIDAIGPATALILKVHQSNFYMGGFVETPTTEEIAAAARERGIPFAEDLGSGALVDTDSFAGVEHEPTPAEILAKGVDLVCFSGDKLMGGPQAGVIAGRADLVAGIKKEPFFRALRCDKLILAVLEETASRYLEGVRKLPLLEMLAVSPEALRARADALISALPHGAIVSIAEGESRIGGGTMPRSAIPSIALEITPPEKMSVTKLARLLRTGSQPVIGYVAEGKLLLDLRTVFPRQDDALAEAIAAIIS